MKAYIFDLDGTLLDSMGVWADVDIAFLKKRGIDVPEDYADEITSMGFKEVALYTIDRFKLSDSVDDLLKEWVDLAKDAYSNTVMMKPNSKEYLKKLRESGAKLAIATSSMPVLYEIALRKHDIYDWFDIICNSGEIGSGKSQPDIFMYISDKLNIPPQDCVVFEDILIAIKSAKSIGMTVYGVFDEASKSDWEEIKNTADGVVYDFKYAPLPI